ncbi:MAG: Nif3-like dinuclear metal center hexameric protein [Gammaproteobacteria bacterium]|nr:Nif3-like dinuclear metal center hexameric protein [Gammaproteobacteria bacterium]MCW8910832.1 Nif3-like dinuclear metal center hexameric protein [Gammaproteobacteria bacterium]MCW9004122.1 Nif3-like dinuclear metal center hexameric protein [Gammaproteobacteria bacterium]MCW9055227.1 Nif3-like dinuclear metal center hexameric protein [Gammaproteobacteria bacterium]
MARLRQLVNYCNELLRVQDFRDYCPNGLQVEGKEEVKKIISGVTACQDLIERAVEINADAILVHHGYFWKSEDASIVGIKKNRIAALLENNISLLAYHLPLDAHGDYGNNVTLARYLDIMVKGCVEQGPAKGLLWYGELEKALSAEQFSQHLAGRLNRQPLHLASSRQQAIKTIGWCTGGAQAYIEQAAELGLDAYVSGEVSEQTFHLARELDIHYFAAGHHATESYGVQALGHHLAEQFDLEFEFIDVSNPV